MKFLMLKNKLSTTGDLTSKFRIKGIKNSSSK